MASEDQLRQLRNVIENIRSLDEKTITRPNLGDLSLEGRLQPSFEELKEKLDFATEYAPQVHDNYISELYSTLDAIFNILYNLAELNDREYSSQAESTVLQYDILCDNLNKDWPPFVTAAIEAKGFLGDEGVRKAYEDAVREMKEQSSEVLQEIRQESEEAISRARELAEQIESRARRTAAGISVEDAQKQFQDAQKGFNTQAIVWSGISFLSLAGFVILAIYLWFEEAPDNIESTIYYTAVRLTALGALGAVATFCLRVLRAYLHMRQQNLHRQRVANSIASFVESATTPEHRDLILSYLVQSVATFGSSGLVQDREDHVTPSRLIIDPVTKILTSTESK